VSALAAAVAAAAAAVAADPKAAAAAVAAAALSSPIIPLEHQPETAGARGSLPNIGGIRDDDKRFTTQTHLRCQCLADIIRKCGADVVCLQEVESIRALDLFAHRYLSDLGYEHTLLVEGRDARRVSVGVLSRFRFGSVRTHRDDSFDSTAAAAAAGDKPGNAYTPPDGKVDDVAATTAALAATTTTTTSTTTTTTTTAEKEKEREKVTKLLAPQGSGAFDEHDTTRALLFPRDMLEVEVVVDGRAGIEEGDNAKQRRHKMRNEHLLTVYICHFEPMFPDRHVGGKHRYLQAQKVSEVIDAQWKWRVRRKDRKDEHDATRRWDGNWCVLGSLGDTRESESAIKCLTEHPGLENVMRRIDKAERWTHFHKSTAKHQQTDFMLVSKGLSTSVMNAPTKPVIVRDGAAKVAVSHVGARHEHIQSGKVIQASAHCPVYMDLYLQRAHASVNRGEGGLDSARGSSHTRRNSKNL
jgi:hypothetical protein